jgi:hypothetical protein
MGMERGGNKMKEKNTSRSIAYDLATCQRKRKATDGNPEYVINR